MMVVSPAGGVGMLKALRRRGVKRAAMAFLPKGCMNLGAWWLSRRSIVTSAISTFAGLYCECSSSYAYLSLL